MSTPEVKSTVYFSSLKTWKYMTPKVYAWSAGVTCPVDLSLLQLGDTYWSTVTGSGLGGRAIQLGDKFYVIDLRTRSLISSTGGSIAHYGQAQSFVSADHAEEAIQRRHDLSSMQSSARPSDWIKAWVWTPNVSLDVCIASGFEVAYYRPSMMQPFVPLIGLKAVDKYDSDTRWLYLYTFCSDLLITTDVGLTKVHL